ncbi:MAG: 50S ribosomal protein L20 [Patescibacteria group bacterium]
MTRIKRGKTANKKRAKLLKYAKGFRWGRKSKERLANEALLHAWSRQFKGRKEKKRVYRSLWTTQINAAVRMEGTTYSRLIAMLKKKNVKLDRKILADIANEHPAVFKKIAESMK